MVMSMMPPSYVAKLRALPSRVRTTLLEEWSDPEARADVLRVLNAPDPTRELAKEVAKVVASEVRDQVYLRALDVPPDAGIEGFSFKRIAKRIRKPIRKVAKYTGATKLRQKTSRIRHRARKVVRRAAKKVKKVAKKVAPHVLALYTGGVGYLAFKKYREKAKKGYRRYIKPHMAIIISAIGAVLSPFTGGASLAVAAALAAGWTIARKRKEAKKIEKANKKEAARLAAEVAQEERELEAQADKLFNENQDIFGMAGISPADWAKLSLKEKLAVIEKINKGEMPADPGAAAAWAEETGQALPPKPTQTWQQAMTGAPVYQGMTAAEQQRPIEPPAPGYVPPPTAKPYPGQPGAPAGKYDVYVEGEKVGSASTPQEMAMLVQSKAQRGDRLEVLINGKSTGLKLYTKGGLVPVPPERAAQINAMSPEQIRGFLGKAEGRAEKKSKGFPWWIAILAGGAAVTAAVA